MDGLTRCTRIWVAPGLDRVNIGRTPMSFFLDEEVCICFAATLEIVKLSTARLERCSLKTRDVGQQVGQYWSVLKATSV